jgi:hypothetical protein
MNKYLLKSLGVLAVALVTAFAFTACGTADNTAEIDKLKQERDTAITERNTAQVERDAALAGKNDALNQMAFYKTIVDALSAEFQIIIDAAAEAKNAPAEIRELFGLVADVLQNAKDGEITAENVGTLREVFAAQFTPKFTALYNKVKTGETGYTADDGYTGASSNTYYNGIKEFSVEYYVSGLALYEFSIQTKNDELYYVSVWNRNREEGTISIFVTDDYYSDGDILAEVGDNLDCYPNGVVEYYPYNYTYFYVKNGELIAVTTEDKDYNATFTFTEGTYGVGDGYFIGDISLGIDEDNMTITINGGTPMEIGTTEEFEAACEELEIDFEEVFDGSYAKAVDIYLAGGYGGLIASVNEKIAIMEQIIAKILELAA